GHAVLSAAAGVAVCADGSHAGRLCGKDSRARRAGRIFRAKLNAGFEMRKSNKLRDMPQQVSLGRRAFFSAGRVLRRADWNEAQNRAAYGREVSPHGHDYIVT